MRVQFGLKAAILCAALAVNGAVAMAQEAEPIMIKGKPYVYDPDNAQDVMRVCAGCHGEAGAGSSGIYPRLAGLNADYLAEQLHKFMTRERENIPMIPFAVDRELSQRDALDVTRYLSEIKIATRPPADMPTDGLARLVIMKKVLQIPREPGDVEAGREFYASECGPCHGRKGEGRLKRPPLAAQHIAYLKAQVTNFISGKRAHDDVQIMRARSETDWLNLWAFVSSLSD